MTDQAVRRVVTERKPEGASLVVSDGPLPPALTPEGLAGVAVTEIWATEGIPEVGGDTSVSTENPPSLLPGPGGTRFRLVQHAPQSRMAMHATDTLDYVLVLSGELWMQVEGADEAIRLKEGDCVIQQGARHTWENRSVTPATTAVVVIGGHTPTASGNG